MACSCRASSLRLFVRGLSQLHSIEPLVLRALHRAPITPAAYAPRAAFSTTPLSRDDVAGKPANDARDLANDTADDLSSNSTLKPSEDANDLTWTIDISTDAKSASRGPHKPRSTRPERKSKKTEFENAKAESAEDSIFTSSKPSFSAKKAASEGESEQSRTTQPQHRRENWQLQKDALKKKFPEGWRPMKRLSPDAVAGIRALHAQFPEEYTTAKLVEKFEVSPEAVRRILKSKWQPSPEEEEERQTRWFRRGKDVWARYAELGMKPPQKWRAEGVTRDPSYHDKRQAAIARRKEEEAKEAAGARLQRKVGGGFL
ncbi:hypothetical protein ACHAQH_001105 [Verticillium albo-atrum]